MTSTRASLARPLACAAVAGLAAGWAVLVAPAARWLAAGLAAPEYRASLALALALAVAGALRLLRAVRRGEVVASALPDVRPAPLALAAAFVALYAAALRFEVELVASGAAILATWAIAGLFVRADPWRAALPAVLALAAALPLGHHLDVYVGFPARVVTARAVHAALGAAGVPSVSAETVLVLESGAATVDVPCSGVKGLWVGAIFLLAATAVERRRIGARWLALAVGYAALLLAANGLRVALLVLAALVLERPDVAALAHVPLGVIGFTAASALAWAGLRFLPGATADEVRAPRRSPWLLAALLPAVWGLALACPSGAGSTRSTPPAAARPFAFGPAFEVTAVALSPAEASLYARHGGEALKLRIATAGARGSLLLVPSRSWRAHHAPEQCFAAAGRRIDALADRTFATGLVARDVRLDRGARRALYWFQSPDRSTPDLLARAWLGAQDGDEWVLVSLVLDEPVSDDALGAVAADVRDVVARALRRSP